MVGQDSRILAPKPALRPASASKLALGSGNARFSVAPWHCDPAPVTGPGIVTPRPVTRALNLHPTGHHPAVIVGKMEIDPPQ